MKSWKLRRFESIAQTRKTRNANRNLVENPVIKRPL
jgi:hypothetical protein